MVSNTSTRVSTGSNSFVASLQDFWKKKGGDILPPVLGLLAFLTIWQIFSSSGLTRLPGPLSLWTDTRTRELLLYPFFDLGGLNKGLFWQTLASLGRVAQGYSLAALVGISVGVLVGTNQLINKATYPIFQFLRMVAPLAWVPIALVALQQNQPAAIFVIFITAVWP
ncbi:MAG TPA: nitrate ABC transporter, permease protein, partial [Leptolyngbyaceae cyanobacterium]